MMGAGHFEMAPLSDFTVTEIKYGKKSLPIKTWYEWRAEGGHVVEYHIGGRNGRVADVYLDAPRPLDFEVVEDSTNFIWNDDPEYVAD